MLFNKLKNIIRKDFFKNVLTLMSGTAIAQLISFLAIPVLSRLFTPEEFGIFAVYFSLSSILAAISAGRYELAIMLPKKDLNAYHLFVVSFWFVIIISVLSFIIILIFSRSVSEILEIQNYKYLIFLVPVSVFLLGTFKIFNNWFSRFKSFKSIALSKVAKTGTAVSSKIGFGFLSFNTIGLVFGEIIGQFFSVFVLLIKNRKLAPFKRFKINRTILKKEMKENKNFPFFSMPMAFLNSISVNILVYVLTIIFNTTIVGLYSQANKVINYPLSFISSSFTTVFYQKLTQTKNKVTLYLYSYLLSFISALFILFPIIFWGKEIFSFVLGKEWAFSGEIAKLLIPVAVAGFATRNVSVVFSFLKLQQITLIWQILFLTIALFIFYYFKGDKLETLLIYFSLFGALMYIVLAFIGFKILKEKFRQTPDIDL